MTFLHSPTARVLLAAAAALSPFSLHAQQPADPLSLPPRQWAIDATQNELKVLQYGAVFLRYRTHSISSKGDLIRDVIESKDGPVARLIYKEGRPLTAQEDAAERSRLQDMLDSPSAFAKHTKSDASGKKTAAEIIGQVPDAMLFTYVPGQPQRPGHAPEVVIDFEPNPKWSSPTMSAQALTGLKGRAWIDARTHYLTHMDGHIFQPVSLGLILAKIYPGGELTFEQAEIIPNHWLFTHFTEHLTIRAMMVKTIKEDSEIQGSQHVQVPPMSYQDAIHTLLNTPLPK